MTGDPLDTHIRICWALEQLLLPSLPFFECVLFSFTTDCGSFFDFDCDFDFFSPAGTKMEDEQDGAVDGRRKKEERRVLYVKRQDLVFWLDAQFTRFRTDVYFYFACNAILFLNKHMLRPRGRLDMLAALAAPRKRINHASKLEQHSAYDCCRRR